MKRLDLYFPKRNYHSWRRRLVDYYGTRTISPFPRKKLFIHEMTSKSTTTVLKETTQDSQRQASWKGNQPIGRQLKKKVLYISILKSTAVDTNPHKSQKNITTTVQVSGAGSKPLITLSAMGFISATYSENCSSEQPTAIPSPIKDKFAEGRKDLTNPKAWAK